MPDEQEVPVGVRSIFGAKTRRGLVELTVGDKTTIIPPQKAREVAGFLLECAASAEGDEALMRTAGSAGLSDQRALQLLRAMRLERNLIFQRARKEALEAVAYDQFTGEEGDDRA